MTWASLISATNERMPPNRTYSTYITEDNVLKGAGAFFTLGFSLLFTGPFQPGTVSQEPTFADFEATTPIAARLYHALGQSGCSNPGGPSQIGGDCTLFFVVPRQANTRWRLTVEQTYRAKRVGDERDADCTVSRTDKVNLRTSFEAKTRSLLELTE